MGSLSILGLLWFQWFSYTAKWCYTISFLLVRPILLLISGLEVYLFRDWLIVWDRILKGKVDWIVDSSQCFSTDIWYSGCYCSLNLLSAADNFAKMPHLAGRVLCRHRVYAEIVVIWQVMFHDRLSYTIHRMLQSTWPQYISSVVIVESVAYMKVQLHLVGSLIRGYVFAQHTFHFFP